MPWSTSEPISSLPVPNDSTTTSRDVSHGKPSKTFDEDDSIAVNRFNQIVRNYFRKAALTILRSRVSLPQALNRDGLVRVNKWFNIEIEETAEFDEDFSPWNKPHVLRNRPPGMIVEIFLDSAELPSGQQEIYGSIGDCQQESARNNDEAETAGDTRQHSYNAVLERWHIALEGSPDDMEHEWERKMPSVYKECIVYFRSLFTMVGLLPAWSLSRVSQKPLQNFSKLCYRIYQDDGPKQRDLGGSSMPLAGTLTERFETYDFGTVSSSIGSFSLKVIYRTGCNIGMRSTEATSSQQSTSDERPPNPRDEVHESSNRPRETVRDLLDQTTPHRPNCKPISRSLPNVSTEDEHGMAYEPEFGLSCQSLPDFYQEDKDNKSSIRIARHPSHGLSSVGSESSKTEDDYICDLLKFLEQKKVLKSFHLPPPSTATNRSAPNNMVPLSKLSKLRDECIDLSNSMSGFFHDRPSTPPNLKSPNLLRHHSSFGKRVSSSGRRVSPLRESMRYCMKCGAWRNIRWGACIECGLSLRSYSHQSDDGRSSADGSHFAPSPVARSRKGSWVDYVSGEDNDGKKIEEKRSAKKLEYVLQKKTARRVKPKSKGSWSPPSSPEAPELESKARPLSDSGRYSSSMPSGSSSLRQNGVSRVPQQYPFISQQRRHNGNPPRSQESVPEFTAPMPYMESTKSERLSVRSASSFPSKPKVWPSSDGGRYKIQPSGHSSEDEEPLLFSMSDLRK